MVSTAAFRRSSRRWRSRRRRSERRRDRRRGIWWRQTPHGGDPLFWADPPSDGRWQRAETLGGLYFADSEQTAWAEWYRALAEFAIPPDRQMPSDLWRWQVDVERVADLSAVIDWLRLVLRHLSRPSGSGHPAFQAIGERLWNEGFRGILAPSAARPNQRVLCLFREADDIDAVTSLRPPMTYRRAPATTDRHDHLTGEFTGGRSWCGCASQLDTACALRERQQRRRADGSPSRAWLRSSARTRTGCRVAAKTTDRGQLPSRQAPSGAVG